MASPRALVDEAAALGHTALALTDRDSVAGSVEFLDACAARGVRGIVGAEITPGVGKHTASHAGGPPASTLLLAQDDAGFATVCRVVTARNLDADFDLVRALDDGAPGAFVLCGDPDVAARLRERVPRDRLFLALPPAGSSRALRDAARALDLPLAAIATATFLRDADSAAHRILRAAALGVTEEELAPSDLAPSTERLAPPPVLTAAFHEFPDAVAAAARIGAACTFTLPSGRPIFPNAPLPAGADALEHLRASCVDGLRRLSADTPAAHARLTRELEVIAKLGFVSYFVIVGDIVRAARARAIPTVGRGSGASSIVAYALGITNVNPIEYDLVFERFLHEKRADCPDLDIDLCWRGRDEVIEHVYQTYGRDRVAMISTHVLFHPRSAFREAARAAGLPPKRIDSLSKLLPSTWETAPFGRPSADGPRFTPDTLAARLARDSAAHRIFTSDAQLTAILDRAQPLLGIPRHFGIHSGGIVIADRPLTAYTALTRAAKGIVVTQHEMRSIEKIGLVKIDLLGNRALSVLRDTVELVRRTRRIRIDLEATPDPSPVAAPLLAAGDALGVFQIESPGMRNLLRQLRPRDLDGVIAALSLIRPGPAGSGMKDLYVLRARGLAPHVPGDPRMDRVLRGNHGILLYEEDVMRVVALVAGVPMDDADGVRRAIGKARTPEEWRALERWFVARAVQNGFAPDAARAIWADLARFGAYAFCKAHASGYGVLAHRMAHLKALYPAEFAVAFLNNGAGMYPSRVHVEDARRRGVEIRGPCVARSGAEFSVERGEGRAAAQDGGSSNAFAIRVGLATIAGLSSTAIDSILAARAERRFSSLEDLLRRTSLSRPEAEALVLSGACDVFGENRPRLLWRLLASAGAERAHRDSDPGAALFSMEAHRTPRAAPLVPDYDSARRMEIERTLLGFPIEAHPLAARLPALRRAGIVLARDLARHAGRRVTVAGLASARRRVDTKSEEPMMFLTLEDPTGLVECTIFPAAYRRAAFLARRGGALQATGRVEDHAGAVTVTVDRLAPLADETTTAEPSANRSADSKRDSSSTVGAPDPPTPHDPSRIRSGDGEGPSWFSTGSTVTNAVPGVSTMRSAYGKSEPGKGKPGPSMRPPLPWSGPEESLSAPPATRKRPSDAVPSAPFSTHPS